MSTCLSTQYYMQNEWTYAAAQPHLKTQILTSDFNQDQKIPDDDHLTIETRWSDFKCFSLWHLN
jgi:hypothetical protein